MISKAISISQIPVIIKSAEFLRSGIIETFAGTGVRGFAGDSGPALEARLNSPTGVAVDAQGNVFIADSNNDRIRRVRRNGIIETVAGSGERGYNGDQEDALQTTLQYPRSLIADRSGNTYFIDGRGQLVRRLDPSGRLRVVAGRWAETSSDTMTTGDRATEIFLQVDSIALDPAGDLFLALSRRNQIVKVNSDGALTIVAGNALPRISYEPPPEDVPATSASLAGLGALAIDADGRIFFAENEVPFRLRFITAEGKIRSFAERGSPNLAVGPDRAFYIAGGSVTRFEPPAPLRIIAGATITGFDGDGGPASEARLGERIAVAADKSGNVYGRGLEQSSRSPNRPPRDH